MSNANNFSDVELGKVAVVPDLRDNELELDRPASNANPVMYGAPVGTSGSAGAAAATSSSAPNTNANVRR